jgi:hypothetical protein
VRPPAAAPTRRPEQVEMRRAGFSATTRQGIKNTSSPAGNVGERARRRAPLNAAFDPGGRRRRPRTSTAAAASVAPIARAPSSAPNRNIAKTKSPPAATSPSCGHQPLHQPGGPSRSRCAAPESRPPPPRDKERQLASRKCRRESTPQPQSGYDPMLLRFLVDWRSARVQAGGGMR